MQYDSAPGLLILLDYVPDEKRVALATKLGIAVVAEYPMGMFELLNPTVAPALISTFRRSAASS